MARANIKNPLKTRFLTSQDYEKKYTKFPLFVHPNIIEMFRSTGAITDEDVSHLDKGHVVFIAGYWIVAAKN